MKTKIFLFVAIFCILCGCKDATQAQFRGLGKPHKITIYSGGIAIKTYRSSGSVSNQENSDGYYFEDISTGKLVEVSGTIIVEQE